MPRRPARLAGELGFVRTTITPSTPSCAATGSEAETMPRPGVGTRPVVISSDTTRFTVSTGMANPSPAFEPEGEKMAVFTPISRPAGSSSGPPELPGFIAASV